MRGQWGGASATPSQFACAIPFFARGLTVARPMPPFFSSTQLRSPVEERRDVAKERLYVFAQTGGWLLLLACQVFFIFAVSPGKQTRGELIQALSITSMVVALGWLITHHSRSLIHRWGWKRLGWKALAPRVFMLSMAQSAVISVLGYGYPYLVLQLPWTLKTPLMSFVMVSWVNCTLLFLGWHCVYFIYDLFDRFSGLEIERLRLATEVKEAELRALKSQVNPHFIFNALNSLRALIDEDPARARQAVTQLANLLRYSLQSAQAETVPFEDELRVVTDYLALEQVRHEERLRLRLDIAPETLGLSLPPLVLQTLVENAVKYGISPRPEGGEITIVARRENDELRLWVSNPGTLDLHTNGSAPGRSTGLGLKNAAERLKLSFGEHARLQVRATDENLVIAEVAVPAQSARN